MGSALFCFECIHRTYSEDYQFINEFTSDVFTYTISSEDLLKIVQPQKGSGFPPD